MRSVILLILAVSAASAGGYHYRNSIPANYRFWESPAVVELQKEILERLEVPPPVDIAALEPIRSGLPADNPQPPEVDIEELASDAPVVDATLVSELSEQVMSDARVYVNDLSVKQKNSVLVKKADHFVSANQILELLTDDAFVELVAPLSAKPITQALPPRSRSLISKLGSDFDTKASKRLVLIQTSSAENLQLPLPDYSEEQNANEPVLIVRKANAVLPVLPELVREDQLEPSQLFSGQSRQPKRSQITIADILKDEKPAKEDSIYYVRTVKPDDIQGIWGIIVDGLTENFANGIAISRDETVDTYQVNIPRLSDDALPDNTSSFLGKLVDRKTRECFVYNFVEKKIGQNPNLIYPGQELLIINFEAEELIDIYTYFVENS